MQLFNNNLLILQGVGGVVQYPRTYLRQVYDLVKSKGGLCIADEVQTGFGRTGDNFWGFEGHQVQPDIVTVAKGIGNGFPLGAVITSIEIADCLNKALHFNTFGGNPIACVVGSTVLDVIIIYHFQIIYEKNIYNLNIIQNIFTF